MVIVHFGLSFSMMKTSVVVEVEKHLHVFDPSLSPPTVMSGNSADSYSEGDSDGERRKEKGEVAPPSLLMVRKGRTNSRTPRARKLKVTPSSASPLSPSLPGHRRGSGGPKSGVCVCVHSKDMSTQIHPCVLTHTLPAQANAASSSARGQTRSAPPWRST